MARIVGRLAPALGVPRSRVASALSASVVAAVSLYVLEPSTEPPGVDFQAIWPTSAGAVALAGGAAREFAAERNAASRTSAGRAYRAAGARLTQRSPDSLRDICLGLAAGAALTLVALKLFRHVTVARPPHVSIGTHA